MNSTRKKYFIVSWIGAIMCIVCSTPVKAQVDQWERPYQKNIEDNSFLIEEAFNQEEQVVQHILTTDIVAKPSKETVFSWTQEWPMFGVNNQLSYSIPYYSPGSSGANGLGDIVVKYRYQLHHRNQAVAVAPVSQSLFLLEIRMMALAWDRRELN